MTDTITLVASIPQPWRDVIVKLKDENRALLSERDALAARVERLEEFYAAAVADGCQDDPTAPEDESIGWIGNKPMTMTYGHIRRAALQEKQG
ncbi:hypothetical protein [Pseudooceanicola atlanticus]|uniref:hypothetical protein n=1 Tax=Pseudooceanicola atlanticus TaxID=1461694 RepID=UPI002353F06A|nr:hypothetical protein [Pseudooceanicola atlanticus]